MTLPEIIAELARLGVEQVVVEDNGASGLQFRPAHQVTAEFWSAIRAREDDLAECLLAMPEAAQRDPRVMPGWTVTSWIGELRRKADRCHVIRPLTAACYLAWADRLDMISRCR